MKILLLFTILLAQCKKAEDGEPSSLVGADNALRVTASYIGDEKCVEYYRQENPDEPPDSATAVVADNNGVKDIITHMLDGKNGELISEELKMHWQGVQFSGDRFFARGRNKLTLEEIEGSCRLLVLSVDSDESPIITFIAGGLQTEQKDRFTKIRLDRFGDLDCDSNFPFCTFSDINAGKRYFILVKPDKTNKKIQATVTYYRDGKKVTDTITIPDLSYASC